MKHIIETQGLSFSYGKKPALKNISIQIHENQLIGLIGCNGSGKTTLMKLFAGLFTPNEGTIMIDGQNPVNNLSVIRDIIYSYVRVPYKGSLRLEQIIDDFGMFYENFDKDFAYKLLNFFSLNRKSKYSGLSICSSL